MSDNKKINDAITITALEAPEALMDVLNAGLVPYMASSPGIGKSSIYAQIAKDHNLKLIDMRLAGKEPTDLSGFPTISGDRAVYRQFADFPLEGDELPWKNKTKKIRYDGWLLLLDELPLAHKSVQKACYQLILDRQVGSENLHESVAVCAAGNLASDNAMVQPLSTALQSRMIHYEMSFSTAALMKYAHKKQWDSRIIGYLNWKPQQAHNFNPNHTDKTYPCPRTWEFMDVLIEPHKSLQKRHMAMLCGTVGQGAGTEFYSFCQLYHNLPSLKQLLADPENVALDTSNFGLMFALCSIIEANIDADNAPELMKLINRLEPELQVVCLSQVISNKPDMLTLPCIMKWVTKNSSDLIAASI